MKIGSLFSGVGGADLAVQSVFPGAHPAWFVEFDKHPSAVLARHWPDVPNYGDITAVDWAAVEPVDILTGGFPCQDLSVAGKRAGLRPGTPLRAVGAHGLRHRPTATRPGGRGERERTAQCRRP